MLMLKQNNMHMVVPLILQSNYDNEFFYKHLLAL